ncbi:SAM-dependent methyltransferase [Oleiphilus messinensis]|uniref:SAM-dependent methyltransferase n=1 Tax=Oleiphilus messinensis TaxID=141451 RepID=A0A1Y0I1M4_9GAMM|nr:class I SAM-dependent methyltransferase [Oleiphilus messinensis]ARU54368.1 SAM-dependent methyltransferase [Oleiphilus messinensis]
MRAIFETIYETNEWGKGSGEGSFPEHTGGYVRFLEKFIKTRNIKSIVDVGCGDWQFSRYVNWQGASYQGFDVVQSVIEQNQAHFTRNNVAFHLYSGKPETLPDADLLIAKDVLQHWSNENVQAFLPLISRYKYALITNCINVSGVTENQNINDGEFRPLDLRLAPFNLKLDEVFSFTNRQSFKDKYLRREMPRWRKRVLLFQNSP